MSLKDTKINTMRKYLFILIFFIGCDAPSKHADNFMKKIYSGSFIGYTSDLMIKDVMIKSGNYPKEYLEIFDFEKEYFNYPESIIRYELTNSYSYEKALLDFEDISLEAYESDTLSHHFGKNYEEYVNTFVEMYSKRDNYRFDSLNQVIVYAGDLRKIHQATYRVVTLNGIYKFDLILVKGVMDRWEIGMALLDKI